MRIVWKFSRNKKLVGGVLLVLSILLFTWTLFGSTTIEQANESDVFYDDDHVHKFIVDHAKPYQRTVEDPVEFIPNRKRTLKTYYGVVEVKDLSFIPTNPLKKSQSLLPRMSNKQVFDKPVNLGLGSRPLGRGLAPLMPRSNSNASKLYSILQKLQNKRMEINTNKEGGRGQFLNSEKMLALQAQMRERESRSMKNTVKDSYFQKGGGMLNTPTNNTRCKKQMCTDFLTSYDLSHYRYCMKKAKIRYDKEPSDSKCNFINGTMRDAVALVSHQGSGHLWVRELLQKSTGVCTGGAECDVKLRRSGFPGENLRSGVVLVVNTHQTEPTWTGVQDDDSIQLNKLIDIPVFGSAILLVRDPFNALANLWQHMRRKSNIADERWSDFVLEQVTVWQQIVLSWMTANPNHPLLVVKYEDLHLDTEAELMKMLDFLRAPYSASVVQELSLNLNDEEEEQLSVVYTVDEREYINSVIKSTIETLTIHKIDDTECDLSLYLRS